MGTQVSWLTQIKTDADTGLYPVRDPIHRQLQHKKGPADKCGEPGCHRVSQVTPLWALQQDPMLVLDTELTNCLEVGEMVR